MGVTGTALTKLLSQLPTPHHWVIRGISADRRAAQPVLTPQSFTFHTRDRERGEDGEENDSLLLPARRLRHLLPLLSGQPFHLTVSRLSDSCIDAIEAFDKRAHVEQPVEFPPVEQPRSPMMSQLAAACRGQPCWFDTARVCEAQQYCAWMDVDPLLYERSFKRGWRRRISAACLAHITDLPRAVKRARK